MVRYLNQSWDEWLCPLYKVCSICGVWKYYTEVRGHNCVHDSGLVLIRNVVILPIHLSIHNINIGVFNLKYNRSVIISKWHHMTSLLIISNEQIKAQNITNKWYVYIYVFTAYNKLFVCSCRLCRMPEVIHYMLRPRYQCLACLHFSCLWERCIDIYMAIHCIPLYRIPYYSKFTFFRGYISFICEDRIS